MFSRLRKAIGIGLVLVGSTLLIGMAGADDVAVMQGVHNPFLPLLLKGILYLSMMAAGAILIGGDADESNN